MRCIVSLAVLTLVAGAALAQTAPPLAVGARVRFRHDPVERWEIGRLIRMGSDQMLLRMRDGSERSVVLGEVVVLQTPRRSRQGALIGGVVGGAAGLAIGLIVPAAVEVPDQDRFAYAVFGLGAGGLVGTAMGASRKARTAGALGALAGVVLGTVVLGGMCERDSPPTCPLVWGGGYGAIPGLIIGAAIGAFLPNWVTIRVGP